MREYFVYILRCNDGSYYTGVTNNYSLRVSQHQEGIDPDCYTYERRPLELVHLEFFTQITEAISREKQIKRWSRAKKEALIAGDEKRLFSLAECKNNSHYSFFGESSFGSAQDDSANSSQGDNASSTRSDSANSIRADNEIQGDRVICHGKPACPEPGRREP